jgi:hypothetical protein
VGGVFLFLRAHFRRYIIIIKGKK